MILIYYICVRFVHCSCTIDRVEIIFFLVPYVLNDFLKYSHVCSCVWGLYAIKVKGERRAREVIDT